MDSRQLDEYWRRLSAEQDGTRVGKFAEWNREDLDRCFEIFEYVETIVSTLGHTSSVEGMLIVPGDPRAGHGRYTVVTYAPFARNGNHEIDARCSFVVRRLDGGDPLPRLEGKTRFYLGGDIHWEQGVNLVIYGPTSELAMLAKRVRDKPPGGSALIGEVEGKLARSLVFVEDQPRLLERVTLHLFQSTLPNCRMSPFARAYPLYLAGKAVQPNEDLEVLDKYSGKAATRVALADTKLINAAIAAAVAAERPMRRFPPHARQAVLDHCVTRFRERFDELALALCVEAGKPIKDAEGEVTRLIDTFRVAAGESVRIDGEMPNLEISARTEGYRGFVQRVPIGACSFITPFNFPLNLVAHKVAPAIAAGCPFVLKPSEKTPIGALIIGAILAETDLPAGAFSILPCRVEDASALVEDDRLKLLSFTGGQIGWKLKARAGRKKVVLELGGNAACIVDADQHGELAHVVERLVFGAFYQSGQSCIKVQRVFAHASIYEELKQRFVAATRALKSGDPRDRDTFLGPLIDEASATRLEQWIAEAREAGATLLCGGGRERNRLEASVLEGVPRGAKLDAFEAFGPVTVLAPFNDFDDALARVDDSDYGLQAGVFTHDIRHAMRAWDELEVGGVIINDVPSFRVDNMPYGGVKHSGLGREGIRCAIADMTEPRLMVLRG